ncbi:MULTISPECIES: NAD-dependent epimerase/dehydratase family protein [unclassified Candidatus Frackibacter]|uniref:NAD-dependent epimerase/dehydratase family protein n=1 Tax=unclassified Candidatus Frackibacter TaxID=2648818 RepID=UPI00087E8EC1|nr:MULTISPECIES: NAD-dependent epimerase/dehydratase family protein [unclassified Candidatus Frackibacter]SDC08489.1 UDP-glucose 4-epimerase [Candidatus Frackibacter sp. WG11]SFL43845.1 UDP-glucose 4-epimerase [Candidatus Frackibacter sp. WG13]
MKHLVTGAAGFIGSNLVEGLLARGEQVVGVDCFTDYYARELKEKNLEKIIEADNFEFIEADLLELDLVDLLARVDYVYHQAAQAGVRASWGQSFDIYTDNNIRVTQQLLEAAKESEIKKFVYASSSSVYGDTDNLPMQETNRLQPVSPYGVSKLAAENLCYLYWKNFGVPTISLRYFTVFGERQRPDMAFHIFIKAILTGKQITIFGDGTQSRNFTYVGDVVQANILAAESDEKGTIFNVGGAGERVTLNRTINIMEEIIGKEAEKEYQAVAKGDVKHTEADETKIREKLGYKPKVGLQTGLEREIAWLRQIYL